MVGNEIKRIPRPHQAHCVKCPSLVLCCLLIISLFNTPAIAEDILVITHQDWPVTNLSAKQVANLFLGLGQNNHGLTPFDLSDKKLRRSFYRRVTGLSLVSIRAKWARQVFTGRGRPPDILKLEQVDQLLSEKTGAVLYVFADQQPEGSKILLTLKAVVQTSGVEDE